MGLMKIRLGDYIERYNEKCNIPHLSVWDVSGINREKEFFEPSKQVGNDTSNYKIVPPNYFACNLMHVGRDVVLPVALNRTNKNKYVSPAYTIFYLKSEDIVLREYLFIFLNSSEKDRYFWFHCDSSVRDGMEWSAFCDIELEIPDKHIQEKYVAIYEGMLANLHSYEKGTDDLKLVCDGFIEDLRRNIISQRIGDYLELSDARNKDNACSNVKSVSTTKYFNDVGAKVNKNELRNYKVVKPNEISYVQTTGNEKCLAFAINDSDEDIVVTSVNNVFRCKDGLNPYYLGLWFRRKEFDRFARFISWGSARETVSWEDMCDVKIPIPRIEVQNQIVEIFTNLAKRISFSKSIKETISNICPILIRGSIMEAKGGN